MYLFDSRLVDVYLRRFSVVLGVRSDEVTVFGYLVYTRYGWMGGVWCRREVGVASSVFWQRYSLVVYILETRPEGSQVDTTDSKYELCSERFDICKCTKVGRS